MKPRVLSLYPLFGWCRQAKLHGLINMYLATVESVQAQLASLPAQEVTPLSPSESAYANGEFCTELVGYPLVAHGPSTVPVLFVWVRMSMSVHVLVLACACFRCIGVRLACWPALSGE